MKKFPTKLPAAHFAEHIFLTLATNI